MLLICENCKKEYEWINGKSKKFCCITCSRQWKNKHLNKEEKHTCLKCGKEYTYIIGQKNWYKNNSLKFGKGTVDSKKFCCYNCGMNYRSAKMEKTNLKKFGTKTPMESDIIKEKSKKTCLKKYGVEYSFQSENNKRKAKETCLKRYGVDNFAKTDIFYQKVKQNNLKKYGVESTTQLKSVQDKMRETCLKRCGGR